MFEKEEEEKTRRWKILIRKIDLSKAFHFYRPVQVGAIWTVI